MYRPFFFPFFSLEGENKESGRCILGDMLYSFTIFGAALSHKSTKKYLNLSVLLSWNHKKTYF